MVAAPCRAGLVPIAVVAALALAGCSAEVSVGGDSSASGEEIGGEIRSDYEDKTGIALRSITCEDVEGDRDERFSCSARNARGVQLEIDGEVTDTESGGFDYSWQVVEGIAPGVLYERALRRQIEAQGVGLAEVRCPVEIEIRVGAEVSCDATDRNGASREVTLRLTDLDGGFDFEVEGHGSEAGGESAGGAA